MAPSQEGIRGSYLRDFAGISGGEPHFSRDWSALRFVAVRSVSLRDADRVSVGPMIAVESFLRELVHA